MVKSNWATNFVLFGSPAGNDALEGLSYTQALTNINIIIDVIQFNPNTTIIIEQMAPARSDLMTSELTDFLDEMKKGISNCC